MLDEKDLQALQVMFVKTETTLINEMDKRIDASAKETRTTLINEMDKRIDTSAKETRTILINEMDKRIDTSAKETRTVLINEMDKRIDASEKKIESTFTTKMNKRFVQSENLILDELDRTRNIIEGKIVNIQKNVDDLTQYYRITKLENDSSLFTLHMIDELRKDFEEFKQKIAQ